MRKIAAIAAAVLLLSACTGDPSPSPSTPTEPHVTLSVPETVVSRGKAQLVLDSAGHDGQTAQLYIFREPFGEQSTCSDTTVRPVPIQLRGGPQQVTIDTGQPGDLWLVLTGGDFETKCGETTTRALINTLAEIAPGCTGEGSSYNCPSVWPVLRVGDEVKYNLRAAVPPTGPLAVEVKWIGPFATAPEAQASPCAVTPEAHVDKLELVLDPDSTGANSNGDKTASLNGSRVIEAPGVYRLLVSIPATPYTAAYEADCEGAPLVTVKQ